MDDPELSTITREAFLRLHTRALDAGPVLGQRINRWIRDVFKTDQPEEAFKNPISFPMLLLPWYAELSLHPEAEPAFQTDLVYSTVNGYYYIRLMDNLMDGHGEEPSTILPVLNFFHTQFQSPYQQYFKFDHPFWEFFNTTWLHSAEVTLRDADLVQINRDVFIEVCAQKTCAAKIPIAAVFLRYERCASMAGWMRFVDLFGCWHQMWNDLFDWVKDMQYETQTYFLSEARRRKRPEEALFDWVIREGFDWGLAVLDEWMLELQAMASDLESPRLKNYLTERKTLLSKQKAGIIQSLEQSEEFLVSLKKALEIQGS
jgi:hypothetical protein